VYRACRDYTRRHIKRQVFLWFVASTSAPATDSSGMAGPLRSAFRFLGLRRFARCTRTVLCHAVADGGIRSASNPGQWRARVLVNGRGRGDARVPGERRRADGRIEGLECPDDARRSGFDLGIAGAGFSSLSLVHLARYTRAGGWAYMSAAQPSIGKQHVAGLASRSVAAGEYWVIVQNPDKMLSAPCPLSLPAAAATNCPRQPGKHGC